MKAQAATARLDDNVVIIKAPGDETDAAELLNQHFDPPAILIPDVLVEGSTIVAAKPKIGKTWAALNICLATANGATFFQHRLPQGESLMIALEDNPRRLQSRLRKMVPVLGAPKRGAMHIRHEWKRGIEGARFLDAYLDANPLIKVVAIDTWRKVAPTRSRGADIVAEDYSTIVAYNEVADLRHVAVIIVMHLKKGEDDADWIDGISGTHGFTAAAGTIMSLRRARGEDTATLSITGRDLERDSELGLRFDRAHGVWELVGTAAEILSSEERREVINVLRLNKGVPMLRKEIDAAVEKIHNRKRSRAALDKLINGMVDAGLIVASAGAGYTLPGDYARRRG